MSVTQQPTIPTQLDTNFIERRSSALSQAAPLVERRQFASSHEGLSDEARELGIAIDRYKLINRRRFITYEEMLSVIKSIGYEKP